MSSRENIQIHRKILEKVRTTLPVGSSKRLELFARSIQGIVRAREVNYNPIAYQSS